MLPMLALPTGTQTIESATFGSKGTADNEGTPNAFRNASERQTCAPWMCPHPKWMPSSNTALPR